MIRLLVVLLALLLAPALAAQSPPVLATAAEDALGLFDAGASEVTFIENRGQWPAEVAFLTRLDGVDVWVTSTGLVFDYHDRDAQRGRVLRARFVGGQAVRVEGRRPKATYHNYLFGNDPARWATRVPAYKEVVLRDVYEGVSLRLHGDSGLQHEWVFAPSADAGAVDVEIDGAEGLPAGVALDRSTVLGIRAPLPAPDRPKARDNTEARREGGTRVGFARFLGGADVETVRALALDADGAAYFGGSTKSDDFPTPIGYDQEREGGRADGYLAQVSTDGSQPYGTYLGGNRDDEVLDLTHANNSVYLTGVTKSPNFPTTPGAYEEEGSESSQEDAFVMRLRTDGSGPVFSTFLGGGEGGDDYNAEGGGDEGDDDAGTAIAVASNGSVVVGGWTKSEEFPAPNGEYDDRGDAFVVVLSGDGTAVQGGTFLGGNQLDVIRAVELGDGTIYVAGDTRSGNFPGLGGDLGGSVDAFVARLSQSGDTVLGGTFVGGSGPEGATGNGNNDRTGSIALALGPGGGVYVSGETASDDFPATFSIGPRGGTDAFVTRLNAQATSIVGTTIFGGSGTDRARGVGIGTDGAVHLVGETTSDDFPVTDGDPSTYGGNGDAFVVQLTIGGDGVSYGTYLGGSESDGAYDLAVGPNGLTYVVGETESGSDFPVSSGSPAYGGEGDAFIATFDLTANAPPTVVSPLGDATLPLADPPFTADLSLVFDDPDGDALSYACSSTEPAVASVGDCSGGTLTVTPQSEGVTTVTISADDGIDTAEDEFVVTVVSGNTPPVVSDPIPDAVLELGDAPLTVELVPVFDDPDGDELSYECASNAPGVASVGDCADGALTVAAVATGEATVTVTASDPNGASVEDAFIVMVTNPPPIIVAAIEDAVLTLGDAPFVVDLTEVFDDPNGDALTYTCASDAPDVAATNDCSGATLTVTPEGLGTATVTVTADDGTSEVADVFDVAVTDPPPVVIRPIPDFPLLLGGDPFIVDLDTVFADPNDDLTFTASTEDSAVTLLLEESVLAVTANAFGTASVTVTATGGPGEATDLFVVTVTDNLPPIVVAPISDITLVLDDDPLEVDLEAVFEDPEGEALTYACSSDAPDVASVSGCSDRMLVVTPEADGEATITVVADDGFGSSDQSFVVTVVSGNAPPFVVDPIDDVTLSLDDVPLSVDLTEVFDDPNGDALTYTCASDAPDLAATNDCADGTLTVTPEGAGTASVTVTAADPEGEDASDTFVVTVESNAPPTVIAPLPDASLELGDAPLVVDLTVVFEDPEAGDLTYACASNAPGVASVDDCSDGTLRVSPVSNGVATVTVTATDPTGASAVDAFVVTVGCAPASIFSVVASPEEPERGGAVIIVAVAERGSEAVLYYRESGAASYEGVPMMRSGGGFRATIPGRDVTARGVEFYVEARSACGAADQSGVTALRVRVPSGIVSPALPAATAQAGYRLVSIPLVLEDNRATSVLADFGDVDEDAWRLFELLPPGEAGESPAVGTDGQWYREDPSDIAVEPGEGYWLIARAGGSFNTGAGVTVVSDEPFMLDLHRGWNLVGAPFGYDLPLDRVRMASGAPLRLQAYDGEWRNVTSSMTPFQGYALRAEADDRLVIDPTSGEGLVAGESGAQPSASGRSVREGGWGVDITAVLGSARDGNNAALVLSGAAAGLDPADWFEPPPIGEYVSLSFTPASGATAPLTVDARPETDEGRTWPLTVRSRLEGSVALTFEGLDSVPSAFVVWLVDEAAAVVRDLRRTPEYTVASQGAGSASSLRLVIGTEDYAQGATGFDGATPSDYRLAPSYPNPFHSTATIQYALPRAEHVVVEVYDVTGRRVAVLVDEEMEAGYHTVVWDGRGGRGQGELASGLYLYRLRAGSFTATRRALLVR